ncbi:MAG: hypothetical protein JWM80_1786, partial [Cyanobacteria bacterium RYN_339]|nr:hypothetical protein [Cyanobacteria bacterium RYN_339]
PPPPPGPPAPPPPPPPPITPTVQGPFPVSVGLFSSVPQFRPTKGRLRIEIQGDAAAGSPQILTLGPDAVALAPAHPITLTGSCDVRLAGSPASVIPTGPYSIAMPRVIGEPAVVLGTTEAGHVAEVIWPNLDPALPPGPPILRIQLATWAASVNSGVALDADFTLTSTDALGNVVTWTGQGRNLLIP